jgi:tripartite-type tricarboxylate transporter receptor subunit TctC
MFLKILLSLAILAITSLTHANDVETIKIVIGFSPGGGSDRVAKNLQEIITKETGTTVVIDYRPGAGGEIAARHVSSNKTNQNNLLLIGAGNIILQQLRNNTVYDLTPVAYIGYTPHLIVTPAGSKFKTLNDILNFRYTEPLFHGHSGIGSSNHIAGELFFNQTGIPVTHVPYRGTPQTVSDLLASRLDIMMGFPAALLPLIETGQLNAIAVAGPNRLAALPAVPSLNERNLSTSYTKVEFLLLSGPGADPVTVKNIQKALNKAFADPNIAKTMFTTADTVVVPSMTLHPNRIMDSELKVYTDLVSRVPELLTNK